MTSKRRSPTGRMEDHITTTAMWFKGGLNAAAWILLCTGCESSATHPSSDAVARISIGSSVRLVQVGDSLDISAVALSADGRVVNGLTVMWTTSDSAVVILRDRTDQGVELVAHRGGVATVTATNGGHSASTTVEVSQLTTPDSAVIVESFDIVQYLCANDGLWCYTPELRLTGAAGKGGGYLTKVTIAMPGDQFPPTCSTNRRIPPGQSLDAFQQFSWGAEVSFVESNTGGLPTNPSAAITVQTTDGRAFSLFAFGTIVQGDSATLPLPIGDGSSPPWSCVGGVAY